MMLGKLIRKTGKSGGRKLKLVEFFGYFLMHDRLSSIRQRRANH